MDTRTFDFQLDGDVTIEMLFKALDAWRATFSHIREAIGHQSIRGDRIVDLQGGSALSITEVSFVDSQSGDRFTELFELTARGAIRQQTDPIPEALRVPIKKLQVAVDASPENGIVWRSPNNDFLITPIRDDTDPTIYVPDIVTGTSESIGVISGRLESLSSRQGLRAVIYDDVFDKAVRCSLPESMRDSVRDKWDKSVEAIGAIRRDARTGRPLSIRDIQSVELSPPIDDPWAWKKAIGVLADIEPGERSEDLVKRMWDE